MTGSRVTGEPGGGSHAARGGGGVFSVAFSSIEAIFAAQQELLRARAELEAQAPPGAARDPVAAKLGFTDGS